VRIRLTIAVISSGAATGALDSVDPLAVTSKAYDHFVDGERSIDERESDPRAGELAERLSAIIEVVDDMAFETLRRAAREGEGRPGSDRKLLQARRSLEKARHILSGLAE
jgi:hypothetical protein